jgi:hypothetical protein
MKPCHADCQAYQRLMDYLERHINPPIQLVSTCKRTHIEIRTRWQRFLFQLGWGE